MKAARLLRWYPRAWRERYGEELLALIQDTADEGRPVWRLRLGVAWGGLRERGWQAARAGRTAGKPLTGFGLWMILLAGINVAGLPYFLTDSQQPARGWQAAALDGVLAVVALTGAVVLAEGLVALPALIRFLRAGGGPKIRRRVAWAAGATVVAGGWLAGIGALTFWLAVTQIPAWLLALPLQLGGTVICARQRLRVAARAGRGLRSAARAGIYPRVAGRSLRGGKMAITIYTQATDQASKDALRRMFAARTQEGTSPRQGQD